MFFVSVVAGHIYIYLSLCIRSIYIHIYTYMYVYMGVVWESSLPGAFGEAGLAGTADLDNFEAEFIFQKKTRPFS